ncbi:MAG: DMT family transporter [Paracoccaceae bacterium]
MRLFLLTSLTMVAFAANSILNRVAVDSGSVDAGPFAVIRVLSGAVMLLALVMMQNRQMQFATPRRLVGAGSLTLYMVGFSLAYRSLDAGLGALLAFGAVQIAIFAISAARGQPATQRQILGSAVAFAGLVWVLWPSGGQGNDLVGVIAMTLAGLGWAIYTLAGREEPDPLAGTAANFIVALPLTTIAVLIFAEGSTVTTAGVGWAVLSGAVTSGLGYALWYSIVPRMAPAIAAVVMLSVPVIALAAGILLLGEVATLRLVGGALLVIGGIAFAVWTPGALRRV